MRKKYYFIIATILSIRKFEYYVFYNTYYLVK